MPSSTLLPRAAVLALLLAACSSTPRSGPEAVRYEIEHEQYDKAVREAAKLVREDPGDLKLVQLHKDATVAWLLDKGRRQTLEDQDTEALATFHEAYLIAPESKEVADWTDKTVRKLSTTWLERGLELHASGKLQEAIEAYGKALEYTPGDLSALNGMGEAVVQVNYREGMSREYFQEGLQALAEYWLERARSRFSYSDKYRPEDPKTSQRREQVDVLLAQQRVTVGKGIEETKRFGAARNEFRLAVALDPLNEEAQEGFRRCDAEFKAFELLAQANMEIVRGRMDHARALIEEGEKLTTNQKELFEGARARIEQLGFEAIYQVALAHERDLEYESAVSTYAELLAKSEYYKDALARKDTIEQYIRLAGELYAQAQATEDPQAKIEALRRIAVFWPEYKDVEEQLRALEQKP